MLNKIKNYWIYILILLPTMTEWVDHRDLNEIKTKMSFIVMTIVTFVLVTIVKKQKDRAEKESITDKLTGIYNSRYLVQELEYQVAFAQRTHSSLSLIFMDLDNFKSINDIFGHQRGNQFLHYFGKSMLLSVRNNVDICFRYGGDEFVILCPQTERETAIQIANRIVKMRKSVQESIENDVTLSIGVVELKETETATDFIKRADHSMYEAKKIGKNIIICSE